MPRPKQAVNGSGSLFQFQSPAGTTKWRFQKSYFVVKADRKVQKYITGTGSTPQDAVRRQETNYKKFLVKTGEAPQSILASSPDALTITVSEVFYKWHSSFRPDDLTEETNRQYLSRIELHIVPSLGNTPVRLLTKEDVQSFIEETLPAKRKPNGQILLSNGAIIGIYRVLSRGLDYAVRAGYIPANPAEQVPAPKRIHKSEDISRKLWIPQHLLQKLHGNADEARWLLSFLYGIRQSEVLGLTDDCLYLTSKKPRIVIKQQLARKDVRHGCGKRDPKTLTYPCEQKTAGGCPERKGGGGYYIKTKVKTRAGERTLPLVEPVLSVLKAHMKAQRASRQSDEWKPVSGLEKLVFTSPSGSPRRQTVDNELWHKLLKDHDVPHERGHLARHISATLLAEAGVPLEVVKRIIGHSETAMTAYYTHIGQEATRVPLENLAIHLTSRQKKQSSKQKSQ